MATFYTLRHPDSKRLKMVYKDNDEKASKKKKICYEIEFNWRTFESQCQNVTGNLNTPLNF